MGLRSLNDVRPIVTPWSLPMALAILGASLLQTLIAAAGPPLDMALTNRVESFLNNSSLAASAILLGSGVGDTESALLSAAVELVAGPSVVGWQPVTTVETAAINANSTLVLILLTYDVRVNDIVAG